MKLNRREEALLKLVEAGSKSVSHQGDHVVLVAHYGADLARVYGGKREVVVAAALVHDLGRSDMSKRGKESAVEGARLAREPLEKVGYDQETIDMIIQCVQEHDQPDFNSDLLESKILKEADYLDGFGARGILRSLVYAGETGGGVREAVERLEIKMKQRLDSLTLPAARRIGWQQWRLVQVYLTELKKSWHIGDYAYSGKLIVLEGISGCGKDSQAELIGDWFEKQGQEGVVVHHPTDFLKGIWKTWREEIHDLTAEMLLIAADRARMNRDVILPALKAGRVVLSTRSLVSAQVYQAEGQLAEQIYPYFFYNEPVADLIIYLDVTVEEAWKRSQKREKAGEEKNQSFFYTKQDTQKRSYEQVLRQYPNVIKIDASGDKNKVFDRVVQGIEGKV